MIEPHYFIAKALNKDGIKVVLNGIGPDETLGGYGWYRAQEKFLTLSKYKFIFNTFASNSYKNQKRKSLLNSKDWYEFYSLVFQRFSVSSDDIFSARITSVANWKNEIRDAYSDCPLNITPIQFLNYLDLMVYVGTHHNHSCDKFLMHQGVEGRFPFLNSDWINFTFWLPDEYKRKNGLSKCIWHELSKKYFPPNYFRGQKKGFGVPNDLIANSSKLKNLFQISINQLIAQDVIKHDVNQILKKMYPNEALSLRLYLLSLSMWLSKVNKCN
jgi:asparagine synthase (glutamine-hydrolysing)